ncbi:MAG: hypothetical protein ACRCXT_12895 [Paraclostridium sp.]|uniref:hypothetical protein n=1 Tax=Romboutsia sp. TaxID=1965302 RepID=UPI003F3CB4C0
MLVKESIINLFKDSNKIQIKHMTRETTFVAELKVNGIYVDKIKEVIEWDLFDKVILFLESQQGKKALKGNAQCNNADHTTVEGYINSEIYQDTKRRITYYGAILQAVNLVSGLDTYLKL